MTILEAKFPTYKNTKARVRKARIEMLQRIALELAETAASYVPVWSGMARSSWVPVTKKLGGMVPIVPKVPSNKKRSPALGRKASKYSFQHGVNVSSFKWAANIYHYLENEYSQSVSPSSPWYSIRAGIEAADEESHAALDLLTQALEPTGYTLVRL